MEGNHLFHRSSCPSCLSATLSQLMRKSRMTNRGRQENDDRKKFANYSIQTFVGYSAGTTGVVDCRKRSKLPAGGGGVGGGEGEADIDGFEDESSESTLLSTSRASNSGGPPGFCLVFTGLCGFSCCCKSSCCKSSCCLLCGGL